MLSLAADRPTVFVLEDLQWADASTMELVKTTAERLPGNRVLMLLTFRPDFPDPLTLGRPLAVLQLRPMEKDEASLIASYVAGGKSLPPEVTSRLDEWTKGVPLYIEEFTKGLR